MFGFMFDLNDWKERFRDACAAPVRALAGAAFVAAALVSIEYDEVVQPGVDRISNVWGSVATDLGRKLSSFTL